MHVEGFIIGPECSGVTELVKFLAGHPTMHVHPRVGAHYFDYKLGKPLPEGSAPKLKAIQESSYLKSFQAVSSKLWIDATETYFYWPWCVAEILRHNAEAKFVVVLREPIERIHHHVSRNQAEPARRFHHEYLPLEMVLESEDVFRRSTSYPYHAKQSYQHQNDYIAFLNRFQARVPEENVLFLDWGRVRKDPKQALDALCDFFEQPRITELPKIEEDPLFWRTQIPAELSGETRGKIWGRCAPTYSAIQHLTGLDTSTWLHI